MRSFALLYALLALSGMAAAQGNQGTGPGLSRGLSTSPTFDISKPPLNGCGTIITQISCAHLATDAPGVYTTGLSIRALCPPYSASGLLTGMLLGKYDIQSGVFTMSTLAANLNIANHHQFNLTLEPGKGRYAVFDRFDSAWNFTGATAGVFLSSRPDASAAFPAATRVQVPAASGLGLTLTYSDPALGYVGGKLKLFYLGSIGGVVGIYMDDLNPTVPSLAGNPVLVKVSPRGPAPNYEPNSPTPITGPDGDVEGLLLADLQTATSFNDLYFTPDLDPNTPSLPVLVSPFWKNNGAIAGGRILCSDQAQGTGFQMLGEAQGAWLLGDVEKPGGTADVIAGAYGVPGNTVMTTVYWSGGIGRPFVFGGIFGQVVLSIPWLPLGTVLHDANQIGTLAIPVPNILALIGLNLSIQGLAVESGSRTTLTVTNNAFIKIR